MSEQKETFQYTYSASEQEEIRKIREKYAPPEKRADKIEQLRRLDRSATKPGIIVSLIVGIIGALIMGTGMSMSMVWGGDLFLPGILVGVIGIAGAAAAYPLYGAITKRRREKLAPEIIRLSDELTK